MSKVKIQGHASGTGVLTITAPNTSTDRTITLPDTTGTLLDENSSLPAANLTGTVADARISTLTASKLSGDLPAISGASLTGITTGKVLQVVQGHATAAVVASSTSWAASTLSATITPSATSSKILIDLTAWLQLNGSGVHGVFTIYRDSTNLGGSYGFGDYYGGSAGFTEITQAASYLDSPSSTSAITYKFYIRTQGSGTVTTGTTGSRVESITLMEIAG